MKIVLLDEKNKDDRKYIKDCNLTDVARVYGGKINASNFFITFSLKFGIFGEL